MVSACDCYQWGGSIKEWNGKSGAGGFVAGAAFCAYDSNIFEVRLPIPEERKNWKIVTILQEETAYVIVKGKQRNDRLHDERTCGR